MANKLYQHDETTLWFVPAAAAQAEDAIFEVDGLASGAGRQSTMLDLGTAARSSLFAWRAWCQFATTPVLAEVIDLYIKTGDTVTTHDDNDDGGTDAAVSSINKLKNLLKIGSIVVDEAVADVPMAASGVIYLPHREVGVVWWNSTADALTTDVDENGFSLTPVPPEAQ